MTPPPQLSTLFPYTTLFRSGRVGDEPVEILANQRGEYILVVRPFDSREPAGKYHLQVTARRNARATAQLLHSRKLARRSEEHTSELQSQSNLVCRLLLEKKK